MAASRHAIEFTLNSRNVQGVGLRDQILTRANQLGIEQVHTYNHADGSVMVHASGTERDRLLQLARESAYYARLKTIEYRWIDPETLPEKAVIRRNAPGDEGKSSQLTRELLRNPRVAAALQQIDAAMHSSDFDALQHLLENKVLEKSLKYAGLTEAQAASVARTEINVRIKHHGGWSQFIDHAAAKKDMNYKLRQSYQLLIHEAKTEDISRIQNAWNEFHSELGRALIDPRLTNKAAVKVYISVLRKFIGNAIPGLGFIAAGIGAYTAMNMADTMRAEAATLRGSVGEDQYQALLAMVNEIERQGLLSAGMGLIPGNPLTAGAISLTQASIEALRQEMMQRYQAMLRDLEQQAQRVITNALMEAYPGLGCERGADVSVHCQLFDWSRTQEMLRAQGIDPSQLLQETMQQIRQQHPVLEQNLRGMEQAIHVLEQIRRSVPGKRLGPQSQAVPPMECKRFAYAEQSMDPLPQGLPRQRSGAEVRLGVA